MPAGQVYPRTHGEAPPVWPPPPARSGLSPHTRGSRIAGNGGFARYGSIPAHTGKPLLDREISVAGRVYPRTHGEAAGRLSVIYPRTHGEAVRSSGLSPHTRGSHRSTSRVFLSGGSIPAHTGKPRSPGSTDTPNRVYPRTHGEAGSYARNQYDGFGLSPHTRGSHRDRDDLLHGQGSIPAHTGKPDGVEAHNTQSGLSPHTRGSLQRLAGQTRVRGSIPAHTGKPLDIDR